MEFEIKVTYNNCTYVRVKEVVKNNKDFELTKKALKEKLKPLAIKIKGLGASLFVLEKEVNKLILNNSVVELESNKSNIEMNKTLKLRNEIWIRTGVNNSIPDLLVDRYEAGEIDLATLNNIVRDYGVRFPIFNNIEDLHDYLKRTDFNSTYSQWDYEEDEVYYSVLDYKNFKYEDITKCWSSDEECLDFINNNHIEGENYKVALWEDDGYETTCIFTKNNELLAHYVTCKNNKIDTGIYKKIKELCKTYGYNTREIIELLQKLDSKIYDYKDRQIERKRIYEEKRRKREQAKREFDTWDLYNYGKIYKFEDIYGDDGEIKDRNKYEIWMSLCKRNKDNFYKNYDFNSIKKNVEVKEEDKPKYKKMYLCLAKNFHPDKVHDDGVMMQTINSLKESWGI